MIKIEQYDLLNVIEQQIGKVQLKKNGKTEEVEQELVKIETRQQLKDWIYENLEVDGQPVVVPDVAVCEGHDSPFDFIYECYFENVDDCIYISCRNGGKTVNMAILEFCEAATKGAETCHLGAILSQAQRAYKYIGRWAIKLGEKLNVLKSTRTETCFGNGGAVEIITGTAKGVNSPHPHKSLIDEFELMDWDIFTEALSMAKSSKGINAATRLATTRKYPSGNAQRMIDEAPRRNVRVFKNCIFEVMKRCDCSVCPNKCDEKYEKYITYDREGNEVKWVDQCKGKAQRCSPAGYFAFKDVLQKFLTMDWEKFAAQWLCHKPEQADNVFAEFHEDRNVVEEFTQRQILDMVENQGYELGRGWDFGLDDPTAVIFFLYQEDGNIFIFNEIVLSGFLIDDIAERVRDVSDPLTDEEEWTDWGDPSGIAQTGVGGGSYITRLQDFEIYVNYQRKKIGEGITELKRLLRKHSHTGRPRLYVTRNCTKVITALSSAQWYRSTGNAGDHSKEKYKHDEYSHPLDAMRYFTVGISSSGIGLH